MEAYDTILKNFWKQGSESDVATMYQAAMQKALNSGLIGLASSTRAGTADMLERGFSQATSSAAKKALALQTLNLVLYNLPPTGRDELLSSGQQTQLKNTVENVNPAQDLYKTVGVAHDATPQQLDLAYKTKTKELAGTTSPEGKAKLTEVSYAHKVLTSQTQKTQYDKNLVEPTVFARPLQSHVLYVYISKIAPTTITELIEAIDAASTSIDRTDLIIDMRGNIGGDLSFAQNAMSLFVGPNAYAYDLFHQGVYEAERTPNFGPLPSLAKYTQIAVLTDGMTQSTAEITASALKKYHLAHVVGTRSRGWGSVEHEFILQTTLEPHEQYALLLVVSLTLGDRQQPIEQNGVSPDIDTNVTGWQNNLFHYFSSPSLIDALKNVAVTPPIR